MSETVKPLKNKTMTLSQLQIETLDLIRKVRFQFNRAAHEDGMSDKEFIDQIVDPLEHAIVADRHVIRMSLKEAALNQSYDDLAASGGIVDAT